MQIQQISTPVSKTHRWNVHVQENTQLSFWRKKSKDQATDLPWMNLPLFSSRLGSAEEKANERRFQVHLVCFYRGESLFWNGNLQKDLGCQIIFSKNDFSVYYFVYFNSFITIVQRTVVKQQHLNCSRIALAPTVAANIAIYTFSSISPDKFRYQDNSHASAFHSVLEDR